MEGLNYATLAMQGYSGAGDLSVGLLLLLWHACERLTSAWLCYWWQCVHQEEKWCKKKKKGSCEHNNLSPVVEVFNRSNCSVLYLLLNLIDQWLFFSVVAGCFDSVGRFLGKCQQSFLWYEECQKSFCFQLCGKEMLALFLQPLWCMLFHHILTDPWLLFGNQIKNKFSEDLLV